MQSHTSSIAIAEDKPEWSPILAPPKMSRVRFAGHPTAIKNGAVHRDKSPRSASGRFSANGGQERQ
jgi:hypothetical protein